jgi:TRAP-type mannitol/chloroaromatic compound transport system permease small subunit
MFLALSRFIDQLNGKIAGAVSWALLAAVVICAGNALIRYAFNQSSNAWLEIQWYLFGAIFMLASAHTLKRNEHVRIDVIVARFSKRTQVWIDLAGFIVFLLPLCALILYYGIPFALLSIRSGEMSSNAGGLIVWPAKLLVPAGFALLTLQTVSEIIKRIAFLGGRIDDREFARQSPAPAAAVEVLKDAGKLS